MSKALRWKLTACTLGALRTSAGDHDVCSVVARTKAAAKAALAKEVNSHAKLGTVYFIRVERVP